jgi:hypothetical protein
LEENVNFAEIFSEPSHLPVSGTDPIILEVLNGIEINYKARLIDRARPIWISSSGNIGWFALSEHSTAMPNCCLAL